MPKHPCADCGKLCDIRAEVCRQCFITRRDRLTEKKCTGCEKTHPIEHYAWRPNGRGGHKRRSRCRDCEAKYVVENRRANPERYKAAKKKWDEPRRVSSRPG